ncbi:unnamed protein product [Discosporangium mesarthrocarpum]
MVSCKTLLYAGNVLFSLGRCTGFSGLGRVSRILESSNTLSCGVGPKSTVRMSTIEAEKPREKTGHNCDYSSAAGVDQAKRFVAYNVPLPALHGDKQMETGLWSPSAAYGGDGTGEDQLPVAMGPSTKCESEINFDPVLKDLSKGSPEVDGINLGVWASRGLLVAAAAVYGTNFGCVKLLEESLPMSLAAALRFSVAMVPFLPFAFKSSPAVLKAGAEVRARKNALSSLGAITTACNLLSAPCPCRLALSFKAATVLRSVLDP